MKMNINEVRKIKDAFKAQYYKTMEGAANHMAIGLGKNKNDEHTIVAMLTNDKCIDLLPRIFQGVEVDIRIVGVVKAQDK